jgi:hypothetical protein
MKNYTPQPNKIFDLEIMCEAKMILLYLNSKPMDWVIYKSEVQKKLELGQTKMNAAWKQLIQAGYIIKTKTFGKVDFALNVNAIRALMSIANATCENATRVSARIPNTDVSPNTDVQQPLTDRKNVTTALTADNGGGQTVLRSFSTPLEVWMNEAKQYKQI